MSDGGSGSGTPGNGTPNPFITGARGPFGGSGSATHIGLGGNPFLAQSKGPFGASVTPVSLGSINARQSAQLNLQAQPTVPVATKRLQPETQSSASSGNLSPPHKRQKTALSQEDDEGAPNEFTIDPRIEAIVAAATQNMNPAEASAFRRTMYRNALNRRTQNSGIPSTSSGSPAASSAAAASSTTATAMDVEEEEGNDAGSTTSSTDDDDDFIESDGVDNAKPMQLISREDEFDESEKTLSEKRRLVQELAATEEIADLAKSYMDIKSRSTIMENDQALLETIEEGMEVWSGLKQAAFNYAVELLREEEPAPALIMPSNRRVTEVVYSNGKEVVLQSGREYDLSNIVPTEDLKERNPQLYWDAMAAHAGIRYDIFRHKARILTSDPQLQQIIDDGTWKDAPLSLYFRNYLVGMQFFYNKNGMSTEWWADLILSSFMSILTKVFYFDEDIIRLALYLTLCKYTSRNGELNPIVASRTYLRAIFDEYGGWRSYIDAITLPPKTTILQIIFTFVKDFAATINPYGLMGLINNEMQGHIDIYVIGRILFELETLAWTEEAILNLVPGYNDENGQWYNFKWHARWRFVTDMTKANQKLEAFAAFLPRDEVDIADEKEEANEYKLAQQMNETIEAKTRKRADQTTKPRRQRSTRKKRLAFEEMEGPGDGDGAEDDDDDDDGDYVPPDDENQADDLEEYQNDDEAENDDGPNEYEIDPEAEIDEVDMAEEEEEGPPVTGQRKSKLLAYSKMEPTKLVLRPTHKKKVPVPAVEVVDEDDPIVVFGELWEGATLQPDGSEGRSIKSMVDEIIAHEIIVRAKAIARVAQEGPEIKMARLAEVEVLVAQGRTMLINLYMTAVYNVCVQLYPESELIQDFTTILPVAQSAVSATATVLTKDAIDQLISEKYVRTAVEHGERALETLLSDPRKQAMGTGVVFPGFYTSNANGVVEDLNRITNKENKERLVIVIEAAQELLAKSSSGASSSAKQADDVRQYLGGVWFDFKRMLRAQFGSPKGIANLARTKTKASFLDWMKDRIQRLLTNDQVMESLTRTCMAVDIAYPFRKLFDGQINLSKMYNASSTQGASTGMSHVIQDSPVMVFAVNLAAVFINNLPDGESLYNQPVVRAMVESVVHNTFIRVEDEEEGDAEGGDGNVGTSGSIYPQ